MKKAVLRSDCPVSYSLDIFGDRWSLLILRDIMFRGKFSYLEFMQSEEKIASNILAGKLSTLQANGIISRKVSPKNKSKYIYQLTKKGIDLIPVLIEIMQWGIKYNSLTPQTPGKIVKQFKLDKKSLLKEYSEKLKVQFEK